YYYGVKGGLQEEIDDRIRAITPLFGKMQQVAGFHPDAKKCVLDQMFQEAGVRDIPGAMLVDVELAPSNDPALQRVASTVLATARGPLRLSADAWIDSTGDGDLGSANKAYSLGRQGDGMFHAYTQSSGRGIVEKDQSKLTFFNYDSGFVDPTDVEDLTRARLTGIGQYVQEDFTEIEHPTYIAFALGLRQGRHVETDYLLQLSDLIERRTFPDSVGLTGCHYDNHAGDYEFESDEAMFWVWVCRQWWGRTACEFPYRMLLPKGLANVWMACRALGVSVDAHHSFRMQRDMQRVGEVAGIAAALSVPVHGESRRIPFPKLREKLIETGAISHKASEATDQFGPNTLMDSVHEGAVAAVSDEQMKAWLAEMENSPPGAFLWHLYRHERACRPQVEALLQSPKNAVTWKAATVLAIWSDPRAEPRLIEAIRAREYGYDEATKPEEKPEQWTRAAPNWLVAVNLLRRCGTAACLQPLFELSGDATLLLNQRTAIGITCESLAQRLKLSEQEKNVIVEILRRLLSTPAPNSRTMIHKNLVTPTEVTAETGPTARPPVVEDFTWQLHLAVAKSLHAAGLPLQPEAKGFLVDSRAIVRRAFGTLDQNF
ncbi:MAG TPA: FAD-dependent oxidoreductase, partial [Tepidisphaeraceae bacterium]